MRDHCHGVTVIKPLKGTDAESTTCLRSRFTQEFPGPVQLHFSVASEIGTIGTMLHKNQRFKRGNTAWRAPFADASGFRRLPSLRTPVCGMEEWLEKRVWTR